MTYTTLKADIASELHRTDLADKIPGFIARAEAYLFRELVQIKAREVIAIGTTTSEYATLPSDFGAVSKVTCSYNGATQSLDYIAQPYTTTPADVFPKHFSFEAGKLRIWGAGDAQAYTLHYIPKLEPLGNSVATNWLLDNAPDLYLYASTLEAAKHVRNQAVIDSMINATSMALDSVRRFAERQGQPATGSMQIKVRRG